MYDLKSFFNVRSARYPSFSPDGKALAFLSDASGVPQLWSQPLAGGTAQQITFFKDRLSIAEYAPDAPHILFGMDCGGDERQQLYILSADGGCTALTAEPDVIHGFGAWAADGSAIAFVSNRRDPAYFDVYVRELGSDQSRLVYQDDGLYSVLAWSPDGRTLLLSRAVTELFNDLLLLDLESRQLTLLTSGTGTATYHSAAWAADGRYIFVITDQGREFLGLARIDVATGELTYLETPAWDVEALAYCRTTGCLAYAVNVDGASELFILDGGMSASRPVRSPRGVISRLAWSPDGSRLAAAVSTDTDNSSIWLFEARSGTGRRFNQDGGSALPPSAFTESRLVRYSSFDGLQIPAIFYLPRQHGRGPMPVVVLVHGGPESQSRPSFSPTVQYLVQRGCAVLAPNVRGSTGYGRTYVHMDDRELRPNAVRDLQAVVDWLVSSGYAEPGRIGIMGTSYGGFMALAAISWYPESWAAAAVICGIANFHTFLEHTGPWRRSLRAAEYGDPVHDEELLRRLSPINYVDRIRAPLVLIHGARDPRVPISEAEQLAAAVREHGGILEYLRFEDEGHGIVKRANRIRAYTAIADFLGRHLGFSAAV